MKFNEDGVNRDATVEEQTAVATLAAELATQQQQHETVSAAARAKLAALGLTDQEINVLFGA